MSNTTFLQYSSRLEINTPIALQEKQHLVCIRGAWFSVFSYVIRGKRIFKCRQKFDSASEAASFWRAVCANY